MPRTPRLYRTAIVVFGLTSIANGLWTYDSPLAIGLSIAGGAIVVGVIAYEYRVGGGLRPSRRVSWLLAVAAVGYLVGSIGLFLRG